MQQNALTPAVVFALNLGDANAELAAIQAAGILNPVQGEGCFAGQKETCWFVAGPNYYDAVRKLAEEHGQDCVLYLDNQYNAYLGTADAGYPNWNGGAQYIGVFKEVPQILAEKGDYSRFGERYFKAIK